MSTEIKLSKCERLVYECVRAAGGDVPIRVLYRALLGSTAPFAEPRLQQQVVGARISRLNKKLKTIQEKVAPGHARSSYALLRDEALKTGERASVGGPGVSGVPRRGEHA